MASDFLEYDHFPAQRGTPKQSERPGGSDRNLLDESVTITESLDSDRPLPTPIRRSQTDLEVALPSGRSILVDTSSLPTERVSIRGGDGTVELEVILTSRGPVLKFSGADLELNSARKVSISCDSYEVRANKEIVHQTGGDIKQHALGDHDVRVKGDLTTEANAIEIRSARGNVQVTANDDVRLNGERVRLNC